MGEPSRILVVDDEPRQLEILKTILEREGYDVEVAASTEMAVALLRDDPPGVILTDKLKSYGAAKREILPGVEHCQHRYLNNRAENSHQPTRQRERRMQGFKSTGHAQRFLAAYGPIAQHFRPRRHRYSAPAYRQVMRARYQVWGEIIGTELAA